ncbi:kinetochore Sim4 complex subunit FTA2-domain-containing protein [Nemania sp. FL0031]|nr:kinetochore Sim4 complex subunit FTA2-domain-containing protein [Nemania sp. FL0031]
MVNDVEENRRLLSAHELPECEGPKLNAFPHRNSPITWIEWINKADSELYGGEGYVFKVEINLRIYALKVFKFFNPPRHRYDLKPINGKAATDAELVFHTDPFYVECRAYGQIEARRKHQGLKRKDIADCYGFLSLTEVDEEALVTYGIDLWCDIPPDDGYRKRAEGSPARALVKEYIEDDAQIDKRAVKRMATAIKWMNRNNILIADIHPRNFKNGYILDFGSSWTKPHCLWQRMSRQKLPALLRIDSVRFKEMVEDLGLSTQCSLRSRGEIDADDNEWTS